MTDLVHRTSPIARLTVLLANRDRVEREVGVGGMATVFPRALEPAQYPLLTNTPRN